MWPPPVDGLADTGSLGDRINSDGSGAVGAQQITAESRIAWRAVSFAPPPGANAAPTGCTVPCQPGHPASADTGGARNHRPQDRSAATYAGRRPGDQPQFWMVAGDGAAADNVRNIKSHNAVR